MGKIYTFNDKIVTLNNKWCEEYVEPTPGPSDEVRIGTQTWKNVNLAIDDGQGGITAYNVGVVNGVDLGTQYYYTQAAAVRIANSITGWHLPSKTEYQTLIDFIGSSTAGTKLKSTSGWYNSGNGTDDYGFNGLPVGYYTAGGFHHSVSDKGHLTYFLTATEGGEIYKCGLVSTLEYVIIKTVSDGDQYSVRLIKDT